MRPTSDPNTNRESARGPRGICALLEPIELLIGFFVTSRRAEALPGFPGSLAGPTGIGTPGGTSTNQPNSIGIAS